jgi:hypothetical protein
MDSKMPALLVGWDLIVRDRNEGLRDEARRERLVRERPGCEPRAARSTRTPAVGRRVVVLLARVRATGGTN